MILGLQNIVSASVRILGRQQCSSPCATASNFLEHLEILSIYVSVITLPFLNPFKSVLKKSLYPGLISKLLDLEEKRSLTAMNGIMVT